MSNLDMSDNLIPVTSQAWERVKDRLEAQGYRRFAKYVEPADLGLRVVDGAPPDRNAIIEEESVEAAAKILAESPLIDVPKFAWPSWCGLARHVLEAGLHALKTQPSAGTERAPTEHNAASHASHAAQPQPVGETPRTVRVIRGDGGTFSTACKYVEEDDYRKLERELSAAKAELAKLKSSPLYGYGIVDWDGRSWMDGRGFRRTSDEAHETVDFLNTKIMGSPGAPYHVVKLVIRESEEKKDG